MTAPSSRYALAASALLPLLHLGSSPALVGAVDFAPLSCNANLTVADCDGATTLSSVLQASNGTSEARVPCGVCAVASVTDGSTLSFPAGLNVEGMLYFPSSANVTLEPRRVFVQGILKMDPPAPGNQVKFRLVGPDEDEYLFPHPDNAMSCDATTGCKVGKRPIAVAGGRLDIKGMQGSETCPGYVPLRSVSGVGENSFGKRQAEDHDGMQGVGISTIVHNFDSGDWASYRDVDFGPPGAEANTIRFRYSKGCCSGKVQARLGGPDGQLIGEITPKTTGSWSTFVEETFLISGAQGVQDLTLVGQGSSGLMNLDWFEIVRYEENLETRLDVGTQAASCWASILDGRDEIEVLVTSAEGGKTWTGHHVLSSSSIDTETGEIVVSGSTPSTIFTDGDQPPTQAKDPRFAAEVAVLTRNIVFESVQDGPSTGGHANLHGGHLIVYHTPRVAQKIEGVQVKGFGQQQILGRYPIHFHMSGDVDGSVVRNNAVVDSNQRCYVIHGTHRVRVENNVAFGSFGHCFILEDGVEEDNHFVGNLGALVRHQLLGIGATDHDASVFWITNTKNHFVDNVATGCQGSGVWFETNGSPRYYPLYTFDGMVTHNNNGNGLITYRPGWRNPSEAVFNGFRSFGNNQAANLHGTCRIKIKNGVLKGTVMVEGNRPGSNILEDTELHGPVLFSLEPNYEMVILRNVTFKGFTGSSGPAIQLRNGNDIRDKYDSPTAWSGIHFDVSPPPYAFAITASNYYTHVIYLEDKEGTMNPNAEAGFFVADKPFMTAFIEDSCTPDIINDLTTFCPGVCLRRLQVDTGCCSWADSDPNPPPADYRMVVTSSSDPSKSYTYDKSTRRSWPYGTKYNDRFDLVLPGGDGEVYDVEFVDLDGNPGFPDYTVTLFAAPACVDHVTEANLRFATAPPTLFPSSTPTASGFPSAAPSLEPSLSPTITAAPTSPLFELTQAENHDGYAGCKLYSWYVMIQKNGWTTYNNINFGSPGTTNFIQVRFAKGRSGGYLQARLGGPTGQVVGTFYPPHTGSWRTYVVADFPIEGAAGEHQLTLIAKTGSANSLKLDWFRPSATAIAGPECKSAGSLCETSSECCGECDGDGTCS